MAAESGIATDIQELFQIRPLLHPALNSQDIAAVLKNPLVFTSAHAVSIFESYLRQDDFSHLYNTVTVGCISGKTKTAVEKALPGCRIVASASYGIALANAMVQLGNIHTVNFFCGSQRRHELPDTLQAAGIHVQEYVIYENIPAPVAITTTYDGMMFFSPSAVNSYFSVNSLPEHTVCFAIGTTTAAALATHTNNKIIISTGTDEASMMQTAIIYFNNINCNE
ncbi:uroporphyrinogen-III synthase [Chitinophaga nivalis]|uniref:Uroporphyrinogen-III synthase n=1 Tax=Chitinophaga nivalis TaxID=2991709 RepID=A0ABT3IG19_9BACT|nr:uroporphyrinogen-III synthase [Chitinophaga nivalis]MCW3467401.1 uroporphyrinogen-III synthase [Chitinophaga nivalis]MCW3482907.1 uroporphyrinogen-III synthase [Chitinophaga nivalis]